MNIKLKRAIVAVTGSVVMLGALAPISLPGEAAAAMRRFAEKPYQAPVAAESYNAERVAVSVETTAEELLEQAEQAVIDAEVVVADSKGEALKQISLIKEVSVVTKPGKPDVGPGVVGLDYNKVIKWQQNVDEGRELWRLEPVQVAKNEGKQYYGFSDKAQYTIIRKLASSAIARHGQIDLEVLENGKRQVMILVRPFGSDEGAIWTTYRVYETAISQPNKPVERVLFQTDKYKHWTWYKPEYPENMGVAVVYSRQPQLRAQQIPQPVLDKLNNVELTDKVALLAYLGGTSSQYGIGIEKVTVKGNEMTVSVKARSSRIGAPETRDLAYPADFVLIDRNLFESAKPMKVTFVDHNGKVLGKVEVSVR